MATLTFAQNSVTFPANETPVTGQTGLAVTVTSGGVLGQFKLDDSPYASTLTEGNLGAVGTSVSFTPDVTGGYLIGLYDAVSGARIAQLAFCVPLPSGDIVPPYYASGDVTDPVTGSVTYGNFRPTGSTWAKYKAKGWKHVAELTIRRLTMPLPLLPISVGAGNVVLTAAQALTGTLVATGSPPDGTRTITYPSFATIIAAGITPPPDNTSLAYKNGTNQTVTIVDPWGNNLVVGAGLSGAAFWYPSGSQIVSLFQGPNLGTVLDVLVGSARGTMPYRSTSGWQGLAPPSTPSVLTHPGGTADPSWGSMIYGMASVSTPPLAATFTADAGNGAGNALADITGGGLLLTGTGASSSDSHSGAFYRPKSGAKTVTVLVRHSIVGAASPYTSAFGLCFGQSSNGKIVACHFGLGPPLPSATLVHASAPPTVVSGTPVASIIPPGGMYWLKAQDNGTSFVFSWSPNGKNWTTLATESNTAYLTGSADRMGLFQDPYAGGTYAEILSYLEA